MNSTWGSRHGSVLKKNPHSIWILFDLSTYMFAHKFYTQFLISSGNLGSSNEFIYLHIDQNFTCTKSSEKNRNPWTWNSVTMYLLMSLLGFPQSWCKYWRGDGVGDQAKKPWRSRECGVLGEVSSPWKPQDIKRWRTWNILARCVWTSYPTISSSWFESEKE